jgi:hypothetical protein
MAAREGRVQTASRPPPFKHSTFAVKRTAIKFIRPDLAVTHVRWRIKGDFDPDGSLRKPRTGIITRVLQRSGRRWRILASQNTNDAKSSGKGLTELLKGRQWHQTVQVLMRNRQ